MKRGWLALFTTVILGLAAFLVAPRAVHQGLSRRPITGHEHIPRGSASGYDARLLKYESLPLSFEANRGQTASEVKFLAHGIGYTLFLAPEEFVVSLRASAKGQELENYRAGTSTSVSGRNLSSATSSFDITHKGDEDTAVLRVSLVGADPHSRAFGVEKLLGRINYFRGSDPRHWATNIPTYARVRFEQVYRGVDLVYYGNQSDLEYDFIVAPRADPRAIRLAISGGEKVELTASGDLRVLSNNASLYLNKPRIYQVQSGTRRVVEGGYCLGGANEVSFCVGNYDADEPLVIDPVLTYATYLAGMSSDFATAIQVDAAGNSYLTGETQSSDFPLGPPNTSSGRAFGDVFLTKLNATGTAVIFTTFLGGSNLDVGNALALDSSGNIYVTGETASPDFPIAKALHSTCDNCPSAVHGFVSKLDPSGSTLIYSTFIAGSGNEIGYAITADSGGNAYVAGVTKSQDFPTTTGAYQPAPGDPVSACQIQAFDTCGDGFVAKIKPDGSAFVYATYLGGSLYDQVSGIAVDNSGNAYVTGRTYSQNFPTTAGSFQPTCDTFRVCSTLFLNIFVTKLNAAGSGLVYSTYLAGSNSFADSWASAIAVDAAGNVYVTGTTGAPDFPTSAGAYQSQCVKDSSGFCIMSAFVSKFNSTGSGLLYSTRIGGNGGESGAAIVVDTAGNAYIAGTTGSTDFPLLAPLESCGTGTPPVVSSGFLTELNPLGSAPVFSTCFGGGLIRVGVGALAVDATGEMYLAGGLQRIQRDLPTTVGAFQTSLQTSNISAGYIVKISPSNGAAAAFDSHSLTFTDQTVSTSSSSQLIDLYSAGSAPLNLSSVVATGDFTVTPNCGTSVASASSCTLVVTFVPTATGTRTGTVVVTDNAADSPQVLILTGTGINPKVTLSTTTVTFGNQAIGTNSTQTVTLTNTGIGPLFPVHASGDTPDFGGSIDCLNIPQGASCPVTIGFNPSAGGLRTGHILISDNAQDSPQSISVSGTGTGPGIVFSTTNVVFPNQQAGTTSLPQAVTITNNGTAPLVISNFQLPTPPYAQTNTCGSSVAAGASCTLSITFAPQSAGNYPGAAAISDNVPSSPQSITLSGMSSGTPQASLSSNNLSFGTVLEGAKSAPQPVTLSNTGNAPLIVSSIAGVGVDYTQTNNCGSSVAAGANCTINVSYAPSSSGANQTRIDITDNAANSPQSITLTGTGTEFLLTSASGASTSQTVTAGQTAQYMLTLTPSSTTRDTVTLSCSGAPATTTCSVLPTLQTFTSTSPVPVSVSVSTTARGSLPGVPDGKLLPPIVVVRFLPWITWLTAFLLLIAVARRLRNGDGCLGRAWPTFSMNLALLVCLSIVLTASACGGGGTPPPPPPQTGTPAGNYSLTVTAKSASSTNLDQSVALTLTVK